MISMHKNVTPESAWMIEAMRYVRQKYGVSYGQQVKEIFMLRNQLEPHRYYYYRLYDPSLTWDEKRKFVGHIMQEAMMLACNPFSWWQALQDKLASSALLRANEIPVPKILAVAHSKRRDNAALHFDNADAAADWLLNEAPIPCFGKLIDSSKGDRSFALLGREDGKAVMGGDEKFDHAGLSALVADMMEHTGLLVQEKLRQHDDIVKMVGPHIASVRVIVLYKKDGPKVWSCGWRIPTGDHVADNFSKEGNLFANVDIETGQIKDVIKMINDYDIEFVQDHPDTKKQLTGFVLPLWNDVIETTLKASHVYANVGLQAWDVAVTPEGAVILEVNPGGNLDNPQKLEKTGLWQGEIKSFVQECYQEHRNKHVRAPWKKVSALINS